MNLKKLTVAVAVGLVGLVWSKAQAVDYTDASITVTPTADVTLSLSPASFTFPASLDVASSSVTPKMTLTNGSHVDVTVTKYVQSPGGWTTSGTPALDNFALYVATAAAQPVPADFSATGLLVPATLVGADSLKSLDGVESALTADGGNVDLYFKLSMPTAVSNTSARTIVVRFTGTAKPS